MKTKKKLRQKGGNSVLSPRFMYEIINRGGFLMTRIEIQKYIQKEWGNKNLQERCRVINTFAWAPQANKVVGNAEDGDFHYTAEEVYRMINP